MKTNNGTRIDQSFLIVDDEPMVRGLIRRILETENCRVIGEASDGCEAVALANTLKPDIVIMDNIMKEMHGIEATILIKENNPATRIIMMTGEPKPSVVRASIEAGVSNFVLKPFDIQGFLFAVRNTCRANDEVRLINEAPSFMIAESHDATNQRKDQLRRGATSFALQAS